MEKKTEHELLMEKYEKEYFKDMPEDVRERLLKLVAYMLLI